MTITKNEIKQNIREFIQSQGNRVLPNDWYQLVNQDAKQLSIDTGYPVDVICAVIAVISPMQIWDKNWDTAQRIVHDVKQYGSLILSEVDDNGTRFFETQKYTGFKSNTLKAINMLITGNINPYLKGNKVNNFYQNIRFPTDNNTFTLDVWMLRIAYNVLDMHNKDARLKLSDKRYAMFKQAFIEVWYEDNYYKTMVPSSFQASLWVMVRGAKF